MSENRGQSERFLADVIRTLYEELFENIKDDRAEYIRSELEACQSDDPITSWEKWCEYNDCDYSIGRALSRHGNICDILEALLAEQEKLDREATEEYLEKQQAYRELQGC